MTTIYLFSGIALASMRFAVEMTTIYLYSGIALAFMRFS